MSDRRDKIISRLMDGVEIDPETGCWNWTRGNSGKGRGGCYGRMYLDGQMVATHIVSYTHFHGYIPGKKQVDHKCRNRACCNPDHLELVSASENCKRREAAKREK